MTGRSDVLTETRGLPGVPASAEAARVFVREILAVAGCPDSEAAELCASELVANSAEHSLSSGPAGTIVLRADAWPGGARLEVRDAGPQPGSVPVVVPAAVPPADAESGRGLWLVSQVADMSGFAAGVAWCQFSWPCEAPVPPPPAAAVPAAVSRRVQRRPGRLARAARRVARWQHRRYAARPLEREARDLTGMPWRHPEILTRRQHELDALAERLWPNCEYLKEMR
jgi:anti-sigma regulatory factor (Ser/Thr protein kinase)